MRMLMHLIWSRRVDRVIRLHIKSFIDMRTLFIKDTLIHWNDAHDLFIKWLLLIHMFFDLDEKFLFSFCISLLASSVVELRFSTPFSRALNQFILMLIFVTSSNHRFFICIDICVPSNSLVHVIVISFPYRLINQIYVAIRQFMTNWYEYWPTKNSKAFLESHQSRFWYILNQIYFHHCLCAHHYHK